MRRGVGTVRTAEGEQSAADFKCFFCGGTGGIARAAVWGEKFATDSRTVLLEAAETV